MTDLEAPMPDIQHVVMLMQENQSFDRVFGWMTHPLVASDAVRRKAAIAAGAGIQYADPEWAIPAVQRQMHVAPHYPARWMHAGFVPGSSGQDPVAFPGVENLRACQPAAHHEWLEENPKAVKRWLKEDADTDDNRRMLRQEIVRQSVKALTRDDVPVYAELASHFGVFARWHSTRLSYTYPNRNAFLDDTIASNGGRSLFRRLRNAGITCEAYTRGIGPLLTRHEPVFPYKSLDQFARDALADDLPRFSWIETRHAGSRKELDNDHRFAHVLQGQDVVAGVYNALRGSPVWSKCLFVVTYDEHGGWFDHRPPPLAPWAAGTDVGWDKVLGGRVPVLFASPFATPGIHDSADLDNTAITAILHELLGVPQGHASRHYDAKQLVAHYLSSAANDGPEAVRLPWSSLAADQRNLETHDASCWAKYFLNPDDVINLVPTQDTSPLDPHEIELEAAAKGADALHAFAD